MRRIRLGSAATRNADLVAEALLMTAGSFIDSSLLPAIFPTILPRHPLWLAIPPPSLLLHIFVVVIIDLDHHYLTIINLFKCEHYYYLFNLPGDLWTGTYMYLWTTT